MIKISSKSQYGLRALTYLAKKDGLVSIADIAQHEHIPFEFLEKIVQKLKNANILHSERGSQGGYALSQNPEGISVKAVLEALDDLQVPVKCLDGIEVCSVEASCTSKMVWRRIYKSVIKELDMISLAEISQKATHRSFIKNNETISCSR